ncbi:MAG: 50S ribosomal protein L25 [Clostridia bacterium]|nr:50S ribosomal protein L25 [Clostridia bacterium]
MNSLDLNLEERKAIGGGKPNRLRKSGYIPAVVYGHGSPTMAVQIKESEFKQFLSRHGKNSLFTTEFAEEHDLSMLVKDIQYDPVHKSVAHVDFQRVSMDEKVKMEVPVRVIGRDWVEKAGNVIVHQLSEVTVECLPNEVPRYIEIDVSDLTPGHGYTAGQLKLPKGVTLISEPNSVLLSITGGGLELKVSKEDEPVTPVGEEGNVHAKRI